MTDLVQKLYREQTLSKQELIELINCDDSAAERLRSLAEKVRIENYGHDIYVRGLIEFSNYCKQDCRYCGIRKSNLNCERYRLSFDEIMECCGEGYALGFRTFVLQSGEDAYFNDDRICEIITAIKKKYPDCALTLSIGEKSYESYKRYYDCGADRYLLRHETADKAHYEKLHPKAQSFENRRRCLNDLKEIGYQTGCGFMVGSPYQTDECIAEDLLFIKEFNPHMVGIGPFISHRDTEYRDFPSGTLEMTLRLLSIIRLMLPKVLLPATTALATIDPRGREKGILAGANVVMPNLSPVSVRKKYQIYDNKICTGDESAQCRRCLEERVHSVGCRIVTDRGDSKNI
ncbi:MAG: [FeFe] hydrogenase H-cluster radical SAM maturase HydE [Ruminococcus sp.]|nr:[FeFe] hydrogenase H-cluster radical SAM maturase HydE [Ruminococcus sp.]